MRRTLLALAITATAFAGTVPATAGPGLFDRPCTGKSDSFCHYTTCGIIRCTTSDCILFEDPYEGDNTGSCIGVARPGDGPGGS